MQTGIRSEMRNISTYAKERHKTPINIHSNPTFADLDLEHIEAIQSMEQTTKAPRESSKSSKGDFPDDITVEKLRN